MNQYHSIRNGKRKPPPSKILPNLNRKRMLTGGKSYVLSSPAFSNDAKRLLVCTGNAVSIFSTSTALQVGELEGHVALVTSVVVVPSKSKLICFCWTSSLDGTMRYWDFSVPELIKTVDVKMPIFSMVIPSILSQQPEVDGRPAEIFAYISIEEIKEKRNQPKALRGQIRKCNLTQSRLDGGIILAETPQPEFITVSPSGKFFGIRSNCRIYVWEVPAVDADRSVVKKTVLHHTKTLTVLAFHWTERIVAAGDVTGRILIWRGFGSKSFSKGKVIDEEGRPGVRGDDDADLCSTWHWHSADVNLLSFSSDGAYLYSGGREGVLVVWQLDTGKKRFLPRIGSPLLYFTYSPDPSLSSVSCADNQIHLLQMPSMKILKSVSGIKLPFERKIGSNASFAFDSSAGLVALPTENYSIQFYSLFEDRESLEVRVCERNHQPGDNVTVVVTLVALSLDGSMMSTTETKYPEEDIGGLICLKFWVRGAQNKDFSLSTIIYEPHRDAAISAIAFHPTRPMAVSSSYGGDFKIWVQSHITQRKDEVNLNSGWTCHAVGSYKKKPMTAASFSFDGSVVAIAAETVITIWDPLQNVLVAVIGETFEAITSLSFVGQSEYLVSASRGCTPQLSVWSLSKMSVVWSYKFLVEAVACAEDVPYFAVLALLPKSSENTLSTETILQGRDGVILLFDLHGPVPIATWAVRQAEGGGLGFVKGTSSTFQDNISDGNQPQKLLAFINSSHEFILFDPYKNNSDSLSISKRANLPGPEETGQYGYASIYGELPEFNLKKDQAPFVPFVPTDRPWETIFSGPSHNLPPLTKLCSAFLESLLEKRPAVVE